MFKCIQIFDKTKQRPRTKNAGHYMGIVFRVWGLIISLFINQFFSLYLPPGIFNFPCLLYLWYKIVDLQVQPTCLWGAWGGTLGREAAQHSGKLGCLGSC